MEQVQTTGVNSVNFQANPKTTTAPVHDNQERQIENGDKKSMDALKWAGIIAAGALAATAVTMAVRHGKKVKLEKLIKEAPELKINDKVKKIGDKVLTYDKGVASLGGEKFTGTFKYKGTTLIYEDGILQRSIKKGDGGFDKLYENGKLKKAILSIKDEASKSFKNIVVKHNYDADGKITKIVRNGESTIFNYNKAGKLETVNDEKLTDIRTRLSKEAKEKLEAARNASLDASCL